MRQTVESQATQILHTIKMEKCVPELLTCHERTLQSRSLEKSEGETPMAPKAIEEAQPSANCVATFKGCMFDKILDYREELKTRSFIVPILESSARLNELGEPRKRLPRTGNPILPGMML